MKRPVFRLLLTLAIVAFSCLPGLAQPDQDVAHWLDRDVILFSEIRDVATTYDRIRSLDVFSNPRFVKAIEMLADERFPIIETDNLEQIQMRLSELESLIGGVRQVSFAVHDLDEETFHWSLFIRAESDVLDRIQLWMRGVNEQLDKTAQVGDPANPPSRPESVEKNSGDPESAELGWCKIRRVEEWLVLSNHTPFLEALKNRIGDESFRSLGKSRKYLAIRKSKSPLNDRDGLVTVYGNPVRMRYFFPHWPKEEWDLSKISEMPACGLKIVIAEPTSEGELQPVVLADAIVKYTQPAAGQARMYEFYRSVDVPPLAVEPIELRVFARDEAAVYAESARLFDALHGPGAAATKWTDHFKEIGLDNMTDVIPRRQAFCEMRFINDAQSADRPGLISMERLLDIEAAHRFTSAITRFANDNHDQQLTWRDDGSSVWWTIPAERFEQNSGLNGFDRTRNSAVDFYNVRHDAYVLTNDWWIQGDMTAVQDQVNLLTSGEAKDHGQPIRNLVKDLTRRLGAEDQPFMIEYFTKDAWQENLNNVEQQYANANMHPVDVQLKFSQLSGGTFVLGLDPDSKDSGGGGNGTFQFQLEGIQGDATGESGDSSQQSLQLNMSSLRMMMPMRLIERNEDGHRIELKRREDLETAIRVMILKSISESFPRQLLLYARNENHIRVIMGAYPALISGDSE